VDSTQKVSKLNKNNKSVPQPIPASKRVEQWFTGTVTAINKKQGTATLTRRGKTDVELLLGEKDGGKVGDVGKIRGVLAAKSMDEEHEDDIRMMLGDGSRTVALRQAAAVANALAGVDWRAGFSPSILTESERVKNAEVLARGGEGGGAAV